MRLHGWDRTPEFRELARSSILSSELEPTASRIRNSNYSINSHAAQTSSVFLRADASQDDDAHLDGSNAHETTFYRITTEMGHRLNLMQQRVSQVEKLVKQRGIFDDHTAEIQTATYGIRQSIVEMNSQLETVERTALSSASQAGPHMAAHYRSVVQALRTRLGEATIQLKRILELRAQTMKTQEDRRGLYSHPQQLSTRESSTAFFAADDPELGQTSSEGDTLMHHGQKSMTQLFKARQLQPLYHTARAEAIENVQHMIGELAQIFNRVASLVTMQEELAVRIEDDMSSALSSLQQGEAHLSKYLRSISSNRGLILKVFGVLLFFVFFFIFFLT